VLLGGLWLYVKPGRTVRRTFFAMAART
jgi:hypothetical protein